MKNIDISPYEYEKLIGGQSIDIIIDTPLGVPMVATLSLDNIKKETFVYDDHDASGLLDE